MSNYVNVDKSLKKSEFKNDSFESIVSSSRFSLLIQLWLDSSIQNFRILVGSIGLCVLKFVIEKR